MFLFVCISVSSMYMSIYLPNCLSSYLSGWLAGWLAGWLLWLLRLHLLFARNHELMFYFSLSSLIISNLSPSLDFPSGIDDLRIWYFWGFFILAIMFMFACSYYLFSYYKVGGLVGEGVSLRAFAAGTAVGSFGSRYDGYDCFCCCCSISCCCCCCCML